MSSKEKFALVADLSTVVAMAALGVSIVMQVANQAWSNHHHRQIKKIIPIICGALSKRKEENTKPYPVPTD